MKKLLRILPILIALCGVRSFAVEETDNNKGILVERTVLNPEGDIATKGGALVTVSLEITDPHTIGFWMRRTAKNPDFNADKSEVPVDLGILSLKGNSDLNSDSRSSYITDDEIPDNEWHYWHLKSPGAGIVSLYRDGAFVKYLKGYIDFLSLGSTVNGGSLKVATATRAIYDDISIWKGTSDSVHQSIAKYGMVAMPESDPDLIYFADCDSIATAPDYLRDVIGSSVIFGGGHSVSYQEYGTAEIPPDRGDAVFDQGDRGVLFRFNLVDRGLLRHGRVRSVEIWDNTADELLAEIDPGEGFFQYSFLDSGVANSTLFYRTTRADRDKFFSTPYKLVLGISTELLSATLLDTADLAPQLVDVPAKPIKYIRLTVASEFGMQRVSPPVQTQTDWAYRESTAPISGDIGPVTFTAPTSIYFDRYGNEISPDDVRLIAGLAYSRADCIGYDVDGAEDTGDGSPNSFLATLDRHTTVTWNWELKYLVGVDSATGGFEDAGLDPGAGSPSPPVGYNFELPSAGGGPARTASIAGTVGGQGVPVRLKTQGYILENTPNATDFSVSLGRTPAAGYAIETANVQGTFTLEFWARRDPVASDVHQVVASGGDWEFGFKPNDFSGGQFSGNQFFARDNHNNQLWTVDEAYSDHQWHHWAVTSADGHSIEIHQDGKAVPVSGASQPSATSVPITVERIGKNFKGALNNLRLWDVVRSSAELKESTRTEEYGAAPNLKSEVPFTSADFAFVIDMQFRDPAAGTWEGSGPQWDSYIANEVAFDGSYGKPVLQAGSINDDEQTSISLTANLPAGQFSFFLKVSSESGYDKLNFSIDGEQLEEWSGERDWEPFVYLLPAGSHTFTWQYAKDGGVSDGDDTAWISDIQLLPHDGEIFSGFIYVPNDAAIAPTNVTTPPISTDDWWRVTWLWEKEYQLSINAIHAASQNEAVTGMPFVRGAKSFDGVSELNANELWVGDGEVVDVGARYRTACGTGTPLTLSSVMTATGSLRRIKWNTLTDGSVDDGLTDTVTREVTGIPITGPGSVTWQYDKTVFRAEVPIGHYLDVASISAANLSLVPDLCGGTLEPKGWDRMVKSTPNRALQKSAGNLGDSLLFDAVKQRVWPVLPGRFRVEWSDTNSDDSYIIEIITDLPEKVVDLTPYEYWREKQDGSREGDAPDYVGKTTMPGISDAFPGSPSAHYTHLLAASGGDQPPLDLDVSEVDRWRFDRFTIGTADKTTVVGSALSAKAEGRSVLVWTYTDETTGTANGDLSREGYLVRVAESKRLDDVRAPDTAISSGRREVLVPDPAKPLEIVGPDGTHVPEDLVLEEFTIDFWSRLNADSVEAADMAVISRTTHHPGCCFSNLEFGYRGTSSASPGSFYVDKTEGDSPQTVPIFSTSATVGKWHHWAIVHGQGTGLQLYRDGLLVGEAPYDSELAGADKHKIRVGHGFISSGTLDGAIDNLRIWDKRFLAMDVRSAMTTAQKSLQIDNIPCEAIFHANFDGASPASLRYKAEVETPLPWRAGAAPVNIPSSNFTGATIPFDVDLDTAIFKLRFSIDGVDCNSQPAATTNGINYGYVADLMIWLSSPSGNEIRLLNKRGTGRNICGLTFDDSASEPHAAIPRDPFDPSSYLTGAYRPEQPLSSFNGENSPGTWQLRVADTENSAPPGNVTAFTLYITSVTTGDASSLIEPDDSDYDTHPEVATVLHSKLDNSGFGSGFILNEVSNYNANIYNRASGVGEWGAIYPVNWSGVFTADDQQLDVAYYRNPYRSSPTSTEAAPLDVLHPNVDWPYRVTRYTNVDYPDRLTVPSAAADNRIYIASRLGTEGVSKSGEDQTIFEPTEYADLSIYNQPDRTKAGFNPNEEHAVVYDSIRAVLTGQPAANVKPKAAFALQDGGLNQQDREKATTYTSDPWVLVQYRNLETQAFEMAAYFVERTREGAAEDGFESVLFPALDPVTHMPTDEFGEPIDQPTNPTYDFDYPIFAGDLLVPPYPLNQVIGATNLGEYTDGGNIQVNRQIVDANGDLLTEDVAQRALWKDINRNNWCVSGGGRFFFENWYPMRSDFWFDSDGDGLSDLATGTPIAWLPDTEAPINDDFLLKGRSASPVKVRYSSYWRSDYPVLKRGETVTFAGGEHKAEVPQAQGLPAILAWASGQVVYDDSTPDMVLKHVMISHYTARLIRPLDRTPQLGDDEFSMTVTEMKTAKLEPADTDKIMVLGPRWYFKELDGSLQKRFYYDSLLEKLVFRGRVNDKELGDPDLTETPISLSVLEPNVMTYGEYEKLIKLSKGYAEWKKRIKAIFKRSQNPNAVDLTVPDPDVDKYTVFWAGLQSPDGDVDADGKEIEQYSLHSETGADDGIPGSVISGPADPPSAVFQHLSSVGVGAALVPNPRLLQRKSPDRDGDGEPDPLYVTLAENNHPEAGGAISLHIIEISPARYRGAIKVIEPQNVFDEKINLQHTGEFGGHTGALYYQWWRREAAPLDEVLPPFVTDAQDNEDTENWQLYQQGMGLHKIEFAGRPDIMLADSLFYVRFGERDEFVAQGDDPDTGDVADTSWRLVKFENDTWLKTGDDPPAPYQYAGASNSPQLQADGSKRYIPQLVMGWVKRVLDRVNPYEARYTDFYSNESPATYSSQLQIAGGPYIGKVALNADKNVIENVGLIELYETVLARAKELTLNIPGAPTDGTNQAILLAATRLSVLYDLLAREAYSDAQNPTIPVAAGGELAGVGAYVHAFQNQEADLLHEELALLRGTDFLKAYPAQNRLFWNYVKGLGEAAYNAVYNIHDENEDGFINEFDAAKLYPQGHGDAWGHFLSATRKHYELLNHNAYTWLSRAELYSLLDNVIEADYLDEKTFARVAAAKARTGKEIVQATYREAYTEDPDGQWQGYTDPQQAWGVSEWSKRAGQGAYFDWLVANALVPEDADSATDAETENLHDIDRRANIAEISEIAGSLVSIQRTADDADAGHNPLGFDSDAIAFDIDPTYDEVGSGIQGVTHFEQIYERAIVALANANAALANASSIDNQIRGIADGTRDLQVEALRQDIDYRNRLIEIFGLPYDGKIGPGQVYPEGYVGPDMLLYMYVDRNTVASVTPESDPAYSELDNLDKKTAVGTGAYETYFGADFAQDSAADVWAYYDVAVSTQSSSVTIEIDRTAEYAFRAADRVAEKWVSWGKRGAYGQIQATISEMLAEEVAIKQSFEEYRSLIGTTLTQWERLEAELDIEKVGRDMQSDYFAALTAANVVTRGAEQLEARAPASLYSTGLII